MHTFEVKKREKSATYKQEGSMKGEKGLYKKLKIPSLSPQSRLGVAKHSNIDLVLFYLLSITHST